MSKPKLRGAVTLSAASASPVSVDYATSDGTAAAGSDYVAASGTLNMITKGYRKLSNRAAISR